MINNIYFPFLQIFEHRQLAHFYNTNPQKKKFGKNYDFFRHCCLQIIFFSGNPLNAYLGYLVDQDVCRAIKNDHYDPRGFSLLKADGSKVHIVDLATPSLIDYFGKIAD